jgi:hypothetical protein
MKARVRKQILNTNYVLGMYTWYVSILYTLHTVCLNTVYVAHIVSIGTHCTYYVSYAIHCTKYVSIQYVLYIVCFSTVYVAHSMFQYGMHCTQYVSSFRYHQTADINVSPFCNKILMFLKV